MQLSVKELYVNNVKLPTPMLGGLVMTTNKIWSANTGRLESTGEMAGTIVAIKHKVEIKWPPLSMEEVAIIEAAVSDPGTPFSVLKYTDMQGKATTMNVYFGDPTYTIYSYSHGNQRVEGVSVSAIEQ